VRIPISRVQVGDRLLSDTFNDHGVLVLSAHTVLEADDISKLHRHLIDQCDIDLRMDDRRLSAAQAKQRQEEKAAAYGDAVDQIKLVFEQVLQEGKIQEQHVENGFTPLVQHFKQEKDVVSLLIVLNNKDDYTYQHSVQVGMISYYIAKWLGQSEEQALIAGKAGYLHDIGKSKVPVDILQKPSRLTDHEYAEIKKHTIYGYELLKASGFDSVTALAALQHHERLDGTGYPLQIKGDKMQPLSKIVAVADVYSAMISNRAYQKGRNLLHVLREIHRCSFGELEPAITQVFIRNMIPNFVGKKLQLVSGETGTIVLTNQQDYFRPLIQVNGEFIDLSHRRELEIEQIFI
jgi:putative nucleotidyltransferase with HDIG domain